MGIHMTYYGGWHGRYYVYRGSVEAADCAGCRVLPTTEHSEARGTWCRPISASFPAPAADTLLHPNNTLPGTGCIFHYDESKPEGSGVGFVEADTPNFTGSYYSYIKVGAASCMGAGMQRERAAQLTKPSRRMQLPPFASTFARV